MLLAKLLYRLGVSLARRLGMYGVRDVSYASMAFKYAKRFGCNVSPILDVGCGKGDISNFMARLHGEVLAIDIDSTVLRSAGNGACFVAANANRLPFREGSFGMVCMFSLLEHVVKPEAVVREATRVLKKKGIVIVQLPNLQWFIEPHTKWPLLGLMPNSIREVVRRAINYGYINFNTTVRSLIKAFEQSGLTLVALEYFWHGVKRIMFKYYPPAYLLIFRKVDKPIVA